MTSRRLRTAGRFAWRNRRQFGNIAKALTYVTFKPIFTETVDVNTRYSLIDLTAAWETQLGRETLAPTIVSVRGHITFENTAASTQLNRAIAYGLFVGPEDMQTTDRSRFPDVIVDPSQFMGHQTRVVDFAARDTTAANYPSQNGHAFPERSDMIQVRNNYQKRLRPGDHLFFLARTSAAIGYSTTNTQAADMFIKGNLDVRVAVR